MSAGLVRTAAFVVALGSVMGCGGSPRHAAAPTTPGQTRTAEPTTAASSVPASTSPGALQAEANSAAAGDIPDNQAFLTFDNGAAGYAMKYPEGWAQHGSGGTVTFRDKNNIVRVVIAHGAKPSAAMVKRDLLQLHGAKLESAPQPVGFSGSRGFKAVYSTVSAPSAVTGKRVALVVDRYYLWRGGRLAVVDLGTPVGVDNVDAYRLMIESFRWR